MHSIFEDSQGNIYIIKSFVSYIKAKENAIIHILDKGTCHMKLNINSLRFHKPEELKKKQFYEMKQHMLKSIFSHQLWPLR